MSTPSPVRILCLPGFSQNKHIMHARLGFLRKPLKNKVEFDCVDPPFVIDKVDYTTGVASFADLDTDASASSEAMTPETTPRAWFRSKDEENNNVVHKTYVGLDQALEELHKYLTEQERPFDAVFGFSQGACMAALLTALLERPGLHPKFPPHPKLKPLKFCVSVGGFKAADPAYSHFYPLTTTPTLHVVGTNDTIVTPERSLSLIRECEDCRVERHDGSHFIPSKANWKNFFVAYLTSFQPGGLEGDVPPPSAQPGPNSQANSAATTRPGTPEVDSQARAEGSGGGEQKSGL